LKEAAKDLGFGMGMNNLNFIEPVKEIDENMIPQRDSSRDPLVL
jgi:hypothetical protein